MTVAVLTQRKKVVDVLVEIAGLLIEQGEPCMGKDVNGKASLSCAYSNDKGQHCGVGFLLPDDEEDIKYSSSSIRLLIKTHRDKLGPNRDFLIAYDGILTILQEVHDEPLAHVRNHRVEDLVMEFPHSEDKEMIREAFLPWIDMGETP